MKLKELKESILTLLEEYSDTDLAVSDDEDVNKKLIPAINRSQREVSLTKPLNKSKILDIEGSDNNDYSLYTISNNALSINTITVLKGEGIDYYFVDKRLYVKNNFTGRIRVDYTAFPMALTTSTPDDYEMELSEDGCILLSYYVAGDILRADVSGDYQAFELKADKVVQKINPTVDKTIGTVETLEDFFDG